MQISSQARGAAVSGWPARLILWAISSTVSTWANKKPRVARVAFCSSATEAPGRSPVAVPSLRKRTRKSRATASRAVVSQQTLVANPLMITESIPRERRISSRSVLVKAPWRGFSSRTSRASTTRSRCSAADSDPWVRMSSTIGLTWPRTPTLDPSCRSTRVVWTTRTPAARHAAAAIDPTQSCRSVWCRTRVALDEAVLHVHIDECGPFGDHGEIDHAAPPVSAFHCAGCAVTGSASGDPCAIARRAA